MSMQSRNDSHSILITCSLTYIHLCTIGWQPHDRLNVLSACKNLFEYTHRLFLEKDSFFPINCYCVLWKQCFITIIRLIFFIYSTHI